MKHWHDQVTTLANFGPPPWKLNLGCGRDYLDGYVNIDSEPKAKPDLLLDITKPWGFMANCVSHIVAQHVVEHLSDLKTFFQEAYHCMMPDAEMVITVPHPRSDSFLGDPTHVRPIIRQTLDLLSKRNCQAWGDDGFSNTPLAFYWGVDFETTSQDFALNDRWKDKLKSVDDAMEAIDTFNNVCSEVKYTLKRIRDTDEQHEI